MKQLKSIIITITSILGVFLAACGSDSGTGSGIAQAETVYGLGECEESNEGVIKLVTSENQYYKCVDGAWEETEAPVQSSSGIFNTDSESEYDSVKQTLKDLRDGQTYRTAKIGDQVWMAENLNYRYLGSTADLDSSSFCYDDNPANCTKYGRLYMWSAAMDSAGIIKGNTVNGCGYGSECSPSGTVRGVCPQGWHLPSYDEWKTLFNAVGGSSTAGIKLKSTSGWNWNEYEDKDGNGDDAFGFSALPAGLRDYYGAYSYEGDYADFWSSTEHDGYGASGMELNYYNNDYANLFDLNNSYGFSVRCLKD